MKNTIDNGIHQTATANSWRTVQGRKTMAKQSTSDTISRRTTEDARRTTEDAKKSGGDQSDRLCLQKGYLDVRFMVGKQTSAAATFNLAKSLKEFIIAGRQFDANFCLLPLYGDGNPLSRPQDVPNSKDAITVYYRHRLAGNNVTGKIKIQSSSTIAQLKHATSTFKEYLVKNRVHINNAQLGPEEAVVLGWIPGSHPAFSFRDNMREAIKNQMPIEYANVEWALFPKTIYYTRASDGVKLSTSGVSLQVTKQAAGQVDSTREDIAKMWQKVSLHNGGPLVGKHFVPFGKSGDMGDSITTQIIHRQNAMLQSTKQRVLTNLNDIDAIIEMETPETATFGNNGSFTLREAFLSYKDDSGASIFSAIEATQTGGTYRFLFNENNRVSVDMILTDIDEKLEAIGNWDEATVHYRYITTDGVEVSGKNTQAQGKSFWQEHYKLMSGTIPEVVDTNKFDRPRQRRPPSVHMSYSDIARSSGSPLTNSQDGESVDTTIASNVSRQDTNDSGMNMITGLSLMKKRMEEIDNQREAFTTKQQRMDESISTVTSSVSKLSADILAVRIDMNIMSDKLEKKFNEIIALLATTQTPTRKVARGTNSSPVKHAASKKGHADAFGGVVTQRKTQSPPASPAKKVNAETWANMCDDDIQEEYMETSVNILMEVDSAEADGNQ
jgi:hypothetical protein